MLFDSWTQPINQSKVFRILFENYHFCDSEMKWTYISALQEWFLKWSAGEYVSNII